MSRKLRIILTAFFLFISTVSWGKLTLPKQTWLEVTMSVDPDSATVQKGLWLRLEELKSCWAKAFKPAAAGEAVVVVKIDDQGKISVDSTTSAPVRACVQSRWAGRGLGVEGRTSVAKIVLRHIGPEKTANAGIWLDW